MEIKGPNLNSYPPNHTRINQDVKQFYNGQILKAVVAEITNNKILFDLIDPKIAIKFEANGNAEFKAGQIVSLQVIKSGPPLSLNVLDNTNTVTKSDTIINSALKLIIPKQTSMNQLLSNLHYISKLNPKIDSTYTQEVINLSRTVVKNFTSVDGLKSSNGIKMALDSTGVFLEQHLHTVLFKPLTSLKNDVRINLLRLAESVRNSITDTTLSNSHTISNNKNSTSESIINNRITTKNQYINQNPHHDTIKNQHFNIGDLKRIPSNLTSIPQSNIALTELLRNIESSLAKVQYNQLQHFVTDEQSKSNWFFDLPIRHDEGSDIVHFKFTKDNSSGKHNQDNEWSVTLTFNLEKLGDISIQLYLQNNKIGATVWAKKNGTYNLFKQYLPDLQQQMERSGIVVANLRCNKGEHIPDSINSNNILNEKA